MRFPFFPGTNLNELNLDWLIAEMKALKDYVTAWPHSPKIVNGTWYVWNPETNDYESTGTAATGEPGPQGPQGPQGVQGPRGIPGEITQSELDDAVAPLQNSIVTDESNILFIGDSYSTGEWESGTNTDFITLAMQSMGHSRYVKKARGGAAFIRDGNSFLDLLNASVSDVENADKITHIMVFGGSNETAPTADVSSAVATFKQRAKALYPNSRIYIGENGWNVDSTYNYMVIVYKYRLAALRNGISFIDGMYMSQHSDAFKETDGHPNAEGQRMLADFLVSYLTGNKSIFSPLLTSAVITLPSGSPFSSGPSNGTIFTSINGLNTMLSVRTDNSPSWIYPSVQTKTGDEMVTLSLGNISNSAVHGEQNGNYSIPVVVRFGAPSGEVHTKEGVLNIKQGALTLTVLIEDGWKYSAIRIYGFTHIAPYFAS